MESVEHVDLVDERRASVLKSERQKICFVVTAEGTALNFLRGYVSYLARSGWDVILMCSPGPRLREYAPPAGVSVVPIPMRRDPSPLWDLVSLFRMTSKLAALRPDVLVYATPKASLLSSIAGALLRVPVRVYELWGLRVETETGIKARLLGWLEWLTARLSTTYIANSQSLAARASELRVDGGKRAVVLGAGSSHGVDVEYFARSSDFESLPPRLARGEGAAQVPVVGYIGRLHPDKGIDTLFEALYELARSGCEFRVLVVGGDEGADGGRYLDKLRDEVRIDFLGYINDVRPALEAIDVLALPSLREGFPNVVLEAAAMGVPAVVSDATGCRDAVVHGVTGRIARSGNATSFADEIGELLRDADARRTLGEAARSHVVRNFRQSDVWEAHSREWRRALVAGADA